MTANLEPPSYVRLSCFNSPSWLLISCTSAADNMTGVPPRVAAVRAAWRAAGAAGAAGAARRAALRLRRLRRMRERRRELRAPARRRVRVPARRAHPASERAGGRRCLGRARRLGRRGGGPSTHGTPTGFAGPGCSPAAEGWWWVGRCTRPRGIQGAQPSTGVPSRSGRTARGAGRAAAEPGRAGSGGRRRQVPAAPTPL